MEDLCMAQKLVSSCLLGVELSGPQRHQVLQVGCSP